MCTLSECVRSVTSTASYTLCRRYCFIIILFLVDFSFLSIYNDLHDVIIYF